MSIKFVFVAREVEMSDGSQLFELVTRYGDRIASSTSRAPMHDLEMALNLAVTDAVESNNDVVANCPGG